MLGEPLWQREFLEVIRALRRLPFHLFSEYAPVYAELCFPDIREEPSQKKLPEWVNSTDLDWLREQAF